ncbi:MAG TPA: histidine kinase, partial [Vicinamibacterales bacterium]|nr:histidine kinase [Vicinamibacterales bacterium]
WWSVLRLNGAYWLAWAALTPFVFWMARRFRFERRALWRPFLAHLPAAAATSLVHVMTMSLVAGLLRGTISWEWWIADVRRTYWMSVDWEMVTYWALVGTSHALHYHGIVRQREVAAAQLEARLAEARLQSLQRQVHPHFLFNTLHSISALMHIDLPAADRMLALLGDLLRSSLRLTAQEIPLKDELDLLRKYLEIEQIRFQDRLTVSYDIAGETLDALVPSLVLQPLVENAIEHGIAPNSGPGRLEVFARRKDGQLWLEVRDNGVGLREDSLTAVQKGIGVSNTRSRLQCLYGAASRFEFCRAGPSGLTVRVVIPWRAAAETPPRAVPVELMS